MKIILHRKKLRRTRKELGTKFLKNPVIFVKPDTAVLKKAVKFLYSEFSDDVHYELKWYSKFLKAENTSKKMHLNIMTKLRWE